MGVDELELDCAACGERLKTQAYRLRAYRRIGTNTAVDMDYSFCPDCGVLIRSSVRRAITEALIDLFKAAYGQLKQDLQAAGSKVGK